LVVVVRNLTVDWLRARDGRQRIAVPAGLTALQQQIHTAVCVEGRSHVEAYELIRARTGSAMPFHEFLREVRVTQQLAPCFGETRARQVRRDPEPNDLPSPAHDAAESAEAVRHIRAALSSQPADVRLAVELFVVDRLSAADVARAVGWPNTKTVYNRVHRALSALRSNLERKGIGPGDL
jgi:DNA-directed RNA polymerase specialized sigma24 family protein